MRPLFFRSDALRTLLLRSKIATLDELKQVLGTSVDVTVFRLKLLDYLTSFSHIAVDTTPCARSPTLTISDCGRRQTSGFPGSAPSWPPRKDSCIVLRADTSPTNSLRYCMSMCRMHSVN
jgi:hypothetical protein